MKQKTVLLIEDDETSRTICRKVLEGGGYLVEEATDLASALLSASKNVPHVIILDMILPDGTGLEFLDKRKSVAELANVPVIILSSVKDKNQVYLATASGAMDYLFKPIDAKILVQKIRKTLREVSFSAHSFPVGKEPLATVRVPGKILSSNEVGFMLELPVKIAVETDVSVESDLLSAFLLESSVFFKSPRVAKTFEPGLYINEIAIVGMSSDSARKIREVMKKTQS